MISVSHSVSPPFSHRMKRRGSIGLLLLAIGLSAATEKPTIPVPPPPVQHAHEGIVTYEVRDADSGALIPAKLTFVGVSGTPDPALSRGDVGRQEGDAIAAYNRVMTVSGTGSVHIPIGTYDVYVSRGLEWDLAIMSGVQIQAAPQSVSAKIRRVIDTRGYLSADFHVHSACSPDSRVSLRDRVYEFLADGVDMIVSTDHNVVCDYRPYVQDVGANDLLLSATGDEVTSAGWGHFGVFPLPQQIERAGHGAVLVAGKTADEIFSSVRTDHSLSLVTVHHPRIDNEIGYFNLGGFDANLDRATHSGFSLNFDAIEVLNGYQDAERKHIDRAIHDWLSLLNFGHLVTATGNSDTHHLTYNIGGYPRNYVRVADERLSHVTPEEVAGSVRSHHSFFTTGPFVRMHVDGADIGDLVKPRSASPILDLEVFAAPWISVSRAIVYVNGEEFARFPIPETERTLRIHKQLPIPIQRDTYVVVRVDGDRPLSPVVGDKKRFDVRPLLLTNPVFLDQNGNGRFDPKYPHGNHAPKAPPKRRWPFR